jgi:hypothetical protein
LRAGVFRFLENPRKPTGNIRKGKRMYQIVVLVACAVALAVLFIFSGWSEDKSNVGTVATAGVIIVFALYLINWAQSSPL